MRTLLTTRWYYLLLPILLLPSQYVSAHPFHISTAEMEYNAKTGKFEVSLKLHAVDLERAVGKLAGKVVDLELDGVDRLLQSYLAKHFYLTTVAQAKQTETDALAKTDEVDNGILRSKLTLVGKELETSWIWLYFELIPPKSEQDLALVNSVLLDTTDQQINTVSVRNATETHALKMIANKPWAPIGGPVATH